MEMYHVLNRGVDKKNIVKTDDDRMRFVRGLYVFNDRNPSPHPTSQRNVRRTQLQPRDLLVRLHAWCLMDNHYHLLLSPIDDDLANLSLFMKKLNMGYARFYNEKYQRSGYLWQGKYKKIHITNSAHELYIPYYIHLNPLDKKHINWRQGAITQSQLIPDYLKSYRWSSYQDYNGITNFPSIITKEYLDPVLGSSQQQLAEIDNIISNPELAQGSLLYET